MKKTVIGIGLLLMAGLVVAGIGIPHNYSGTMRVVNADIDTFQSAAFPLAGTVTGEGPFQTEAIVGWAIIDDADTGATGMAGEIANAVDTARLWLYARVAGKWTKTTDTAAGFPPCTLAVIGDDPILKYADAFRMDIPCVDSAGSGTGDTLNWTITYGWKQATTRKAGGE